eukprot:358486-Chlamydomonas_euryale.AAC.18
MANLRRTLLFNEQERQQSLRNDDRKSTPRVFSEVWCLEPVAWTRASTQLGVEVKIPRADGAKCVLWCEAVLRGRHDVVVHQHDDGVACDGALLADAVHLFVRLRLDVDDVRVGIEQPTQVVLDVALRQRSRNHSAQRLGQLLAQQMMGRTNERQPGASRFPAQPTQ